MTSDGSAWHVLLEEACALALHGRLDDALALLDAGAATRRAPGWFRRRSNSLKPDY
jgi:hypothetical protein